MARQRLLHTQLRKLVGDAKSWASAIADRCQPPSLRFYADERGGAKTWHPRARKRSEIRPDELLENDLAALAAVELYAKGVIFRATEIRDAARKRIKALEAAR